MSKYCDNCGATEGNEYQKACSAISGHYFIDTQAAANKAAEEGARHPWFCAHCQIGVPSVNVTFEEAHDPRAGGCGYRVGDWPVAAEEGGLPVAPWEERESAFEKPNFSKMARMEAEIEDWREYFSASRQVANKAEVEPLGYITEDGMGMLKAGRPVTVSVAMGESSAWCVPIYATPPATAGASVSTLDSLPDLMDEWVEAARGPNALAVYAKIEALIDQHVAREVAAQSGQVAVPEGLDPRWDDNGEPWNEAAEEIDRKARSTMQATPSPAKESK